MIPAVHVKMFLAMQNIANSSSGPVQIHAIHGFEIIARKLATHVEVKMNYSKFTSFKSINQRVSPFLKILLLVTSKLFFYRNESRPIPTCKTTFNLEETGSNIHVDNQQQVWFAF